MNIAHVTNEYLWKNTWAAESVVCTAVGYETISKPYTFIGETIYLMQYWIDKSVIVAKNCAALNNVKIWWVGERHKNTEYDGFGVHSKYHKTICGIDTVTRHRWSELINNVLHTKLICLCRNSVQMWRYIDTWQAVLGQFFIGIELELCCFSLYVKNCLYSHSVLLSSSLGVRFSLSFSFSLMSSSLFNFFLSPCHSSFLS